MSLKLRFMAAVAVLLLVLMATIVFLVDRRFASTIQREMRDRGLAVAQSIAAVSTNALLTYNYVALEQNAEQASRGRDIVYVIILDKEGRVAAFSGHDNRQGTYLADSWNKRALAASGPIVQNLFWEETGEPVLDIAVPVLFTEEQQRWGTIRVGLSLAPMYQQVRQTKTALLQIGAVALFLGIVGAYALSARITGPLAKVVEATIAAARGQLDHSLDIRTGDEVEELARNFNIMSRELALQRRHLEQRLEEILELMRYNEMILASMSNGVLALDLAGRVVSANNAAETILALKGGAWQGLNYKELWPEPNPLGRILAQSMQTQKAVRNEEIFLARGGEKQRTLMISTSFLRDARDAVVGMLLVFNDVTEVKEMEARMRQADRLAALGVLSAGLAHEIRNPLSAIKTFVQLLPRKVSNTAFLQKFQVTVPRELNRINGLIENLLELARPAKMEFVQVSPGAVLRQLTELYRDELENAGIELLLDIEEPLPEVWADSDHLQRAFANLLKNAKESMTAGGRLSIACQPCDNEIHIQFTDTGEGMDRETADNIFNPFFTTKKKGTGLGLAITHKIIQEHGGSIEAQTASGKGTTFNVVLPTS
ncbi:MAG: PAS domain-containing protein [Deltaproteobacteria bacterium]|nr:PAS domain-containing protein [Deltaproteobacteria bacterium]